MICRRLFAVLAIALLSACSRGAVFHVSLPEARRILAATGLPPQIFGSEPPQWDVHPGDGEVTWIVRINGGEVFRYIAHLKQEDPGVTRVEVEFVGAQSGPGGNVAKRLAEHSEIRDMYVVAIQERVASALEKRPFELARIYPATALAFVANMGALQSSADQAAAASERVARENIQKAYRDEAAGR